MVEWEDMLPESTDANVNDLLKDGMDATKNVQV
jgi:hypothetical protein